MGLALLVHCPRRLLRRSLSSSQLTPIEESESGPNFPPGPRGVTYSHVIQGDFHPSRKEESKLDELTSSSQGGGITHSSRRFGPSVYPFKAKGGYPRHRGTGGVINPRPGRTAILPTASCPSGDGSYHSYHQE